jgi:hypothetical protein
MWSFLLKEMKHEKYYKLFGAECKSFYAAGDLEGWSFG